MVAVSGSGLIWFASELTILGGDLVAFTCHSLCPVPVRIKSLSQTCFLDFLKWEKVTLQSFRKLSFFHKAVCACRLRSRCYFNVVCLYSEILLVHLVCTMGSLDSLFVSCQICVRKVVLQFKSRQDWQGNFLL